MKRRDGLSGPQGGFTLIEVLLALIVAVAAVVVVSQGMASAARATSQAERRSTAAMLAEQKISEIEGGEVSLVHGIPGDFGPDHSEFVYEITSALKTSPDLYEVTVHVTWDEGGQFFDLVRLIRKKT